MERENQPMLVGVIMGSKSDAPFLEETQRVLEEMGIKYESLVISAHRTPEKAREYAKKASGRGLEVIIAAAGGAAHLPGVLASWTTLPVIGIPLPTSELKGVDALYSMAQMPAGVPVATMAIGSAGARNAAFLATEILGLKYATIREAYQRYRQSLTEG